MRKGDRTELAGRLTISRGMNGDNPRCIYIEIEDPKSGLIVLEAELTPEDFGNAVTGRGYQDCLLTLIPTEDSLRCYGKKREVKTAVLDIPHYPGPSPADVVNALCLQQPNWMDGGWEMLDDGTRSQQNDKGWHVSLMRFVEEKA